MSHHSKQRTKDQSVSWKQSWADPVKEIRNDVTTVVLGLTRHRFERKLSAWWADLEISIHFNPLTWWSAKSHLEMSALITQIWLSCAMPARYFMYIIVIIVNVFSSEAWPPWPTRTILQSFNQSLFAKCGRLP